MRLISILLIYLMTPLALADVAHFGSGAHPTLQIPGYPLAEVSDRSPLFPQNQVLEIDGFTDSALFPEPLSLTLEQLLNPNLANLLVLSNTYDIRINVGWRLLIPANVAKKDLREVMFFINGGPALNSSNSSNTSWAKAMTALGHPVVIWDQRGTMDNAPASVRSGQPRDGVTIPLDDFASTIDPEVVWQIDSFDKQAADLEHVIDDVMKRSEVSGLPFFVMGHSCGAEFLSFYMADIGQNKVSRIPVGVVYSGGILPGTLRATRWMSGSVRQAAAYKVLVQNHPDFQTRLDQFYEKVNSAKGSQQLKELEMRALHGYLDWDLDYSSTSSDTILGNVDALTTALDQGGIVGMHAFMNDSSPWYHNKLYWIMSTGSLDGGLTDFLTYRMMSAAMPKLGVDFAKYPSVPNMGWYEGGYDFTTILSDGSIDKARWAFDRQVQDLARTGRIGFFEPKAKDVLAGWKKVGRVFIFNGINDPSSNKMTYGAMQDQLPKEDLTDFRKGHEFVFYAPEGLGHFGLMQVMTDSSGNVTGPSPQLQFALDVIRGNLSASQVAAMPGVIPHSEMRSLIREHRRLKKVALETGAPEQH